MQYTLYFLRQMLYNGIYLCIQDATKLSFIYLSP